MSGKKFGSQHEHKSITQERIALKKIDAKFTELMDGRRFDVVNPKRKHVRDKVI